MSTDSNPLMQIAPAKRVGLTLDEARARLKDQTGPRYWRSLEELTQADGFDELMEREFPQQASEWLDPVSRRNFLKLMSASLAMAGLTGCTKQPHEHIVPYVKQPEGLIPGKPLYYATAMPFPTGALPVLAESHMGRPTKIEGNPEHPASLGATHAYAQASILDLYDPDRAQTITHVGEVQSWGSFMNAIRGPLTAQKGLKGGGFRILTETVTSPTLAAQLQFILSSLPGAKWVQYDPINRDAARAGARMAFGQYVEPQYKLANARVVVSFDADFLSGAWFPGFLRYSRDYMSVRKQPKAEMPRLYVVESTPTTTGAKADHQYRMKASEVEHFAAAVAARLGVGVQSAQVRPEFQKAVEAIAQDLGAHRGQAVVMAGEYQSPALHAIAAAINGAIGAVGSTVVYTEPIEFNPMEQGAALRELVGEMNSGKVDMLLVLGGNPVFNAPTDLKFAEALNKVALRIHLSLFGNETSELCHWHINEAHYLESWSDTRSFDGTASIVQPLIAPLYDGRTAHEVLNAFTDTPGLTSYELIQRYWKTQRPNAPFDNFWRKALHDGFIPDTAFAPRSVTASAGNVQLTAVPQGLELTFRPDPSIYDGRYNNNGWLQETPKPVTKLCWDNAVLVGLRTAQKLGLKTTDVVELDVNGQKVKAPVQMLAGQPDDGLTVYVGYGRTKTGRVGTSTGFNAYKLRSAQAPWATAVKVTPTGDTYHLAITQEHNAIAVQQARDRHVVREASLAEFQRNPNFAQEAEPEPPKELSLYPDWDYSKGYKWGMAIDMASCVGCNSCVVACQAENNIAVVGKDQVMRGREMQWLRVDTYFDARDMDNPRAHFQPIPCMQCELAPCEPVCPVAATVHSSEGLNDMVYNRCVGTRYCSNNCPYKVRRFNFTLYTDWNTESLKAMRNPDVTVRSRGVMEKCTYCVQRINEVRFEAEKEERPIRDMEIVTACQQTCPTEAIVFGNLNDPNSRVSQVKKDPRNYSLLASLQTRPRTTYIAEVTNPNTALESGTETKSHG